MSFTQAIAACERIINFRCWLRYPAETLSVASEELAFEVQPPRTNQFPQGEPCWYW